MSGIVLVTAAGLRLALEQLGNDDAAVLVGVLGILVGVYAVVHDTAIGSFSAFAPLVPAAALLPLAYGAWSSLLRAPPAPVVEQPAPFVPAAAPR